MVKEIAEELIEKIEKMRETKRRVLVAIDGRCGAGKSTLADIVRRRLGCPVIHMDDFFLSVSERTPERMEQPGGNIALERFREMVLDPLLSGEPASYRPFDCQTQTYMPQVTVGAAPVTIVEGSYSLHPSLRQAYDLRVFLDVDQENQKMRIMQRNGGSVQDYEAFATKWIPMEERYIAHCDPRSCCQAAYAT